jgi:hypothetical protein
MQGGQGGMQGNGANTMQGSLQSLFSRIPQGGGMPMGNPATRGFQGFQGNPAMRGGYGGFGAMGGPGQSGAGGMPYYPQGQQSGANIMAGGNSMQYRPGGGGLQLAPQGLLSPGAGSPQGDMAYLGGGGMDERMPPGMGTPMGKTPGMSTGVPTQGQGVPMPKPDMAYLGGGGMNENMGGGTPPGSFGGGAMGGSFGFGPMTGSQPPTGQPTGGGFGFGGPQGGSPMGQQGGQQPQRTGTWLDDYMQQGQDASQQGLAPNFSGSQNGMNFINGRLFAGQGS